MMPDKDKDAIKEINHVSEAEWYIYFTVFIALWMIMIMVMT
tara:strand:- start:45 stop:167 length:123 start_codon:yes stop_codon:yes gene_type:complete